MICFALTDFSTPPYNTHVVIVLIVELVVALDSVMEQLSHWNCDVVKGGTLTIARVDQ